jgi:predicted RND superfamily exporter protein
MHETGVSMLYTAIVLFFGFIIYTASSFGGTVSMGILISFTLIIAVISNLLFLPSLLLWLEKSMNKKIVSQGVDIEE